MFTQPELLNEIDNLKKFALKLAKNMPDAEDLLQSTVLRALEKQHLYQDNTNLFSWTSKIMFNLFVSDYRRKTKFETQYDPEDHIRFESVQASQEIKAEFAKVDEAMKRLSADHRDLLIMVCIKGMQYMEVADQLNVPIGTVRSRLFRARENLRELLGMPSEKERPLSQAAFLPTITQPYTTTSGARA